MALPALLLLSALATVSIDAARWNERLLIVFAPSRNAPMLVRQLAVAGPGTRERDLRLVVVAGDDVDGAADDAATLRRRFDARPGEFRALLIGKDGGIKLDERAPISTERLFATIDAMPMRRGEMRR
ncbi:DUF4174 domain-containing protein [Sandarakinorhabdus sp. DWP1-3-1]|uniref:DUF4174 domain-containing protein n=1 Tax=Sandarakinorhabdus sp. DWP1-3-1 TaxID=2804627 RepID=UPI003CF1E70E